MGDGPLDGASWIWCNDEWTRQNQYGLFRRTVELPEAHGPVHVHACADMRYWLYVNGRRVGFGPGKFDPRTPLYDTHDVTPLVKPGANLIALKVHSIGPVGRCSSFMPTRAGLIASVTWQGGKAATDERWLALEETAYVADTPRFCNHQSFIECFDARTAQTAWEQSEYDDRAWPRAVALPRDALAPWGEPAPRPVANLTLVPRTPCRIIETGRAAAQGDPDDLERIANTMQESARTPSRDVTSSASALFPVRFIGPEDPRQAAYAVFDFAENSSGYLRFRVRGTPGTVVDVGYGEDFAKGKVRCNLQGVRYSDRFILGQGTLEHQLMFPKTLRYLLVEVRRGEAVFERIVQDVSTYPVRWEGGFVCPERPTLARAWQIGAHTVQICMEDVYMDTPRRERAGWLGDMIPEAMAAYYAFGETRVARHALDLFMRSQRPDGWVVGRYPSLDGPNMPTWSASYTAALADYVRYSGDLEFARQVWPGVRRLTQWFEGQRREDDLLVVTPSKRTDPGPHGYVVVDWAPTKLDGAISVMNMFYYGYLLEAVYLAGLLGERAEADGLEALARRTRTAIQRGLFDPERGCFVNCRDQNGLSRQAGSQENLLALLWDIAAADQAERITGLLLPDDRPLRVWTMENRDWKALSTGTQPWEEDSLVPVGSPFFMYYALGALFEIGRTTAALNNIEAHYGGLLAEGETTVWEDFSGDTSRSHGWGAAPTAYAGKYLLGVAPLEPGFKTFAVLPSFGDLRRAWGRVPTPHGTIAVAWQREDARDVLSVWVPEGATAVAGLPASGEVSHLVCDGVQCAASERVLRRGRYVTCRLTRGQHELCLGL